MHVWYVCCPHCEHPGLVHRTELNFARRCRQCAENFAPIRVLRARPKKAAAKQAKTRTAVEQRAAATAVAPQAVANGKPAKPAAVKTAQSAAKRAGVRKRTDRQRPAAPERAAAKTRPAAPGRAAMPVKRITK